MRILTTGLIVAILAGCGDCTPGNHDEAAPAAGSAELPGSHPAAEFSASAISSIADASPAKMSSPNPVAADAEEGAAASSGATIPLPVEGKPAARSENDSALSAATNTKEQKDEPNIGTVNAKAPPVQGAVEPAEPALLPADGQRVKSLDWPQFRGPDGQGGSSSTGLPVRWHEHKNITWKVPIRGLGWSSPAIKDNRIWLTTALDKEKSLRVLCLDCEKGETIHDVEVFHKESLGGIHPKNSHATPTPVLVDDRCYVHFGSHGTAALTNQGEILWKTELKYYHHHGPGGSPEVVDGALVIACDGFSRPFYDERAIAGITDPQFVVALEAATGEVRWKRARVGTHCYSTPLAIEVGGQTQVVSPGGNQVVAYDPATGAEIWSCRYKGYSVVPRPVFGHGLVFVCTGYDAPTLLAIRPDGHGDVTDTHIAWQARQAVPLSASPILIGEELYTISDQGVVSCLDAGSGTVHWRRRLGGNHSASPLYADSRLYFLDESGTTQVLVPGTKCKILAKNLLRDRTLASMAVSGRALYIRSDSHLYRIEERDAKSAEDDHASSHAGN